MGYAASNSRDLASYWMPFTANRQFKAAPRLLVSAEGMHYQSDDGRKILDGTSGLWCVNAGHGRREIADAVSRQLRALDYAPSFQMGHPLAFDFAERLTKLAPAGLDRIFFTNSGSESVDTALKIALAYHRAMGNSSRTRFIGRERGYHGVGFGGISVGGMVNNRRAFPAQLPGVDHLRHTHNLDVNAFSDGQPAIGAKLADDLESLIELHGAETIAAAIVEPIACSAGVLLPPCGYLERLREICKQHKILLIFDEVITGFGRLGAAFASEYFGILPDMMTTAKALTNGAVPMGAVFVNRAIHDVLMQAPESQIELFHGYTYSGHPVACAAGIATLEIYERENLFERAKSLTSVWRSAMQSIRGLPHVVDIRTIGLMTGIELSPRSDTPGARAYEVFVRCFEKGLLARASGNNIAFSPPLIISEEQIVSLVSIFSSSLQAVA